MAALTVEWQGREYAVELAENAILRDVGSAIAVVTHTSFETLKLLQGGRVIIPSASPQRLADETGKHLVTRPCGVAPCCVPPKYLLPQRRC